ncbi:MULTISPECIES: AarF/ABC1/UbiB kinase family protein [unclassified Mesobacillus]|uniref:ABC1 kinase family protein n=1 Tax=unclassified Mesobacillus TaxID=2675270 RepID=UPI002040760F|nr:MULTISPECIES: AarF/ABC1/UbiB kinase family protein [unclassified Mesobacillus]MCM3121908.1 AarF/ABC1/UbiB kinase family protein [Mesobacillus sp. MER 33]MCM3231872.1 AarF/ABC1/UbiB kinase family protein [Mesobacillus sp. MER 48]
MLTDRLRRLNRYKEIGSLFVKYGFGYVLEEVGLFHILSLKDKVKAEVKDGNTQEMGYRIRCMLEELGPAFIKLGQLLSIRSDLLPDEIVKELELLQDQVPPVQVEEIKKKIQHEFGRPVTEIFHFFNEDYVAAASIGQVHEAVLHSGESVMVKVQRPGIKNTVLTDLEILRDFAKLIEQRYDWAQYYNITDMVEELSESIRRELDYSEEARNTDMVQLQFEDCDSIKVPLIFHDYSTTQILTMEKAEGIKLNELNAMVAGKEEKRKIADLLVSAFITQILKEGFFHGDPHPGNILYSLEKQQLVFIDFGQVGRLSASMRYHSASMMMGIMQQDTHRIVKAIFRMAYVPSDIDEQHFYDHVDGIRKTVELSSKDGLSLGLTVKELFAAAQEHRIILPKEMTMMGKALITIEGIISELDPTLDMIEIAKPYGEQLMRERYDPIKMGKRLLNQAEDLSDTFVNIPNQVENVLDKASKGDLKFEISLSEINRILNKFDRISNQVSFSLTLLAFSIVVLGLIVGATFGNNTILTSVPAIEIGFFIAFGMFLLIIYSILRSGRF